MFALAPPPSSSNRADASSLPGAELSTRALWLELGGGCAAAAASAMAKAASLALWVALASLALASSGAIASKSAEPPRNGRDAEVAGLREQVQALGSELRLVLAQHARLVAELRACRDRTATSGVDAPALVPAANTSVAADPAPGSPQEAPPMLTAVRTPTKIAFEQGTDHEYGPERLYLVPGAASAATTAHMLRVLQASGDSVPEDDAVFEQARDVMRRLASSQRDRASPLEVRNFSATPPADGMWSVPSLQSGKIATVWLFLKAASANGTGIAFPRALLAEAGVLKQRLLELGATAPLLPSGGYLSLPQLWEALQQAETGASLFGGGSLPRGETTRQRLESVLQAADKLPVLPGTRRGIKAAATSRWCGSEGVLVLRPRAGDAVVLFHRDLELGADPGAVWGECAAVGEDAEESVALRIRIRYFGEPSDDHFRRLLKACQQ